mmetsp:Transcript_100425/g.281407  ORF Transcript_100425/g.281407 Transcript_100425/m.281407 type:complete len:291 (+) Transcript_100425:1776-2648(+)
MVRAVHLGDAVQAVGGRVGVHQVHEHDDAEAVRGVHEQLQLLRRSLPAGGGEEGGDVVAEAAVVGVLRDGHELDAIVAHALDPGQDVAREVGVGRHLRLAGRHADVSLVDLEVIRLQGALVLEDVAVRLRGLPMHAVEEVRGVVLPRQPGPRGHALDPLTVVRLDPDLHLATVRDHRRAIGLVRQSHAPAAETLRGEGRAVLPIVELADEEDLLGVGQPLPVRQVGAVPVEAEHLVALRELLHAALLLLQLSLPVLEAIDPVPDLPLHGLQRGVNLKNLQRHGCLSGETR